MVRFVSFCLALCLIFLSNVSRMGEFRATFDSTFQNDINSWLGLYLTVGNRYNGRPILQTQKMIFSFRRVCEFHSAKIIKNNFRIG